MIRGARRTHRPPDAPDPDPTRARVLLEVAARPAVWGPAVLVGLGLMALEARAPELAGRLPSPRIRPESGAAYVVPVPVRVPFPYRLRGAQVGSPAIGHLDVLEDGFPLGPPDALHDVIRREGRGAYSHWGNDLYLSSSDGSDPTTNGRTYDVTGRASLDPRLRGLARGLLALAGLGMAAAAARPAARSSPGVLRVGRIGAGLGAIGLITLLVAVAVRPVRTGTLDPATLTTGPGPAYVAILPGPGGGGWLALVEDDAGEPLVLREAGRPLGPRTAEPLTVVESEAGRYAVRGRRLVFSSSDGRDPRTGERRYSWSRPVHIRGLAWLIAAALLLAGVTAGFPGWPRASARVLEARLSWTMRRGPPGDRVLDAVVLLFALWTLCAHGVVAAGGGLRLLLKLYASLAIVLVPAGIAWWWNRPPRGPDMDPVPPGSDAGRPAWSWPEAAATGGGVVVVSAFAWHPAPLGLWWAAVGLLAIGSAIALRDRPRIVPPAGSLRSEALLWLLAAACAAITLIAHRADSDDGFYVAVATAALEDPSQPLLAADPLHGIPGLPLHLPVYRVHTYELLNAALSHLTGIPPLYQFHWVSAAGAAILVIFAQARLLRLLLPERWLAALLTLVVILLAVGDTNHWYGNLAFVRIWQGKAIFLFVLLPLTYVYALRFAARPTALGWVMLAAAQIGAVGCTSSALWAAPAGALLALAATFRPTARALVTVLAGALASTYVAGVGWLIRPSVRALVGPPGQASTGGAGPGKPLEVALHATLGDSTVLLFGIASLLLAWAVAPRGLARRFAALVPLGALLVPLNPYAASWVGANLTGPTYWRAMWAVPIPILMTLLLTAPLHLGPGRRTGWRGLAWLGLATAFALLVPGQGALAPGNSVRLDWPGLKVPPVAYRWAGLVNASVPPGAVVAVPPPLAWLVVLYPHHAYPLDVKGYLWRRTDLVDPTTVTERMFVQAALERPELVEAMPRRFRDDLERFQVRAVCVAGPARAGVTRAILGTEGFHPTERDRDYELWVRRGAPAAGPRGGSPALSAPAGEARGGRA